MLRLRRGGIPRQPRATGWLDLARRIADTDARTAYRRIDPGVDEAQLQALSAAVRQWCRVVDGHPAARLAVPSSAVAEVWRALGGAATDTTDGLAIETTYLLSCSDEDAVPPHLPLLFRVDWMLDRLDGRTYAPNCGEVRYCAVSEGTVCLQHVAHPPRRRLVWNAPAAGISLAELDPNLRSPRRR